jgi:hypothetical protein
MRSSYFNQIARPLAARAQRLMPSRRWPQRAGEERPGVDQTLAAPLPPAPPVAAKPPPIAAKEIWRPGIDSEGAPVDQPPAAQRTSEIMSDFAAGSSAPAEPLAAAPSITPPLKSAAPPAPAQRLDTSVAPPLIAPQHSPPVAGLTVPSAPAPAEQAASAGAPAALLAMAPMPQASPRPPPVLPPPRVRPAEPAATIVRIGSIEVTVAPPPAPPPPASAPVARAPAAPPSTLSRGFVSPFGLRQG